MTCTPHIVLRDATKAALCGLMLTVMSGCRDVWLDLAFPSHKPTITVVTRKRITLEELRDLVQANRRPDILLYSGSRNGLDYFISSHCITTGRKPNQRSEFRDSIYWVPSAQVGFRHHLPFLADPEEAVYYDSFAPVDLFKSVLERVDLAKLPLGTHRLPENASSGTVDGTYHVVRTTRGHSLFFFVTHTGVTGRRGFLYAHNYVTVSDLVRDGLAKGTPGDSRIVLSASPRDLGRLAVFDAAPYNSRRDFFAGWFTFSEIGPGAKLESAEPTPDQCAVCPTSVPDQTSVPVTLVGCNGRARRGLAACMSMWLDHAAEPGAGGYNR